MTVSTDPSPILVGAVGGSGTRVVAQMLMDAGVFMGDDLNGPNDNLFSVLIFNRHNILTISDADFAHAADLFYRYMAGQRKFDGRDGELLQNLAQEPRAQHGPDFLRKRLDQLSNPAAPRQGPKWGWKSPPNHVFLHRLLAWDPGVKYIHVDRHGLDMAFGNNQNQLRTWGPVFLQRQVDITPRDSLSYWCAVHRRIHALADEFPDNILRISFEDLCRHPMPHTRRMLDFVGISLADDDVRKIAGLIQSPDSIGRYRGNDLTQLRPADMEYLQGQGYPV